MFDPTQIAGSTHEQPGVSTGSPDSPDGYELFDIVGRGGMGVVYRARDRALNREVAVKVLLDKYEPKSAAAERFLAESQITGQLQHPGIPAVYRVGRLADGRPFLAMKLIKGETLDELLKANRPLNALAVFEAIAQAVGYAHAHDVIHRDLKPANIMVGSFGEVQVMDWGLAKVLTSPSRLQEPDTDNGVASVATEIYAPRDSESSVTQAGSVLGTPSCMAPEQAAGEIDKVDCRSDVFGLGATFCALLTGKPPFTGKQAEAVRLAAVRGQTGDAFARLDACGSEPDVIALCKRCLSFHPDDRPPDASAVAAEVANLRAAAEQRARQAELAQAKAVEHRKRRRVIQFAAAALVAVLVAGIAGTSYGLFRANKAKTEAIAAQSRAETNLAETRDVLDFVQSKVFAAARPKGQDGGLGPAVTLKEALESAIPFMEAGFRERPVIEAQLRHTLGLSFLYMGESEKARAMFQRAHELFAAHVGPHHPDTLRSMKELATAYAELGQHNEALSLREETFALHKQHLGENHPETLRNMNNLALSYSDHGRHADAFTLYQKTLELRKIHLGPVHRETLISTNNLANSYSILGRHTEALALREEAVKLLRAQLGQDHPETLTCMNNLANSFANLGRPTEALALREETLKLRKARLGADHPDTLVSMNNLAFSYSDVGRKEEALALRIETLALQKSKLGLDHPVTLMGMRNLAISYSEAGRHAEAFALNDETLRLRQVKLGRDHPDTLFSMWSTAESLIRMKRTADAIAMIDECLRLAVGKNVDSHLIPGLIELRLRHFEKARNAAECRTTAEMWEKQGRTDADSLYNAACWRAVTSSLLADDPTQANAEANRAMAWLTKAVAGGYKDRESIEADKDLAALRSRPDYRKLVESLPAKK